MLPLPCPSKYIPVDTSVESKIDGAEMVPAGSPIGTLATGETRFESDVLAPAALTVCHPCAVAPEFMPQTWFAVPFVLMLTARFDVQLVQVPVRLVMIPDAGVPKIGATKVCCPVQVFA